MSEAFEKAVLDSQKLTSKPSNEDLLKLYGLFKVSKGEDIASAPAPGIFDLKGKAKKAAWEQAIKDTDGDATKAQEQYVEFVEKLKQEYGYDEKKVPEAVGGN